MNPFFFPGCKVKATFPTESKKLEEYILKKYNIEPIGCCRIKHQVLVPHDTAIVVCNNCAAIIEENTKANIMSIYEIIDDDHEFTFPDYHGEKITIQDCWIAYEKRKVQEAVRSLLQKMNFSIVELSENYEKTKFCGVNLLSPCTESNAKLAHKRYVEDFPHMFTPMTEKEQINHFRNHCSQVKTERVVCYCRSCKEGIIMGGKQGVHMLELLFPSKP